MARNERKSEFTRHRAEISLEYKRKLDALYTLYPEFKDMGNSAVSEPGLGQQTLIGKIRKLVDEHRDEEITSGIMLKWIMEKEPESSLVDYDTTAVSNALARLLKRGEIQKISPEDTKPVVYKRSKDPLEGLL